MERYVNPLLACGLLLAAHATASATTPTNVVFILTDNHGAWTLGSYGNPEIRTPHLDRMAAEGARFENAFANNPVCSPTRATYLTGLMPSQHGVHSFLTAGDAQMGPKARNTLAEFRSLPEILKEKGYACGLVGKWHLGGNASPQESLNDYWITMPHGGTSTFIGAEIIENGQLRTEPEHLTPFWTKHAVKFLEANASKPFFLYLAYNGPYGLSRYQLEPLRGPRAADYASAELASFPGGAIHPWQEPNREYFGDQTAIRRYAAEVSAIDDGVGEILATLKRLNLDKNTLVVFAGDQGWAGGQHGLWGMGDHTRPVNAFEHSMRIPLIFRHPGGIPAGQVPTTLTSNYDFLPTLLGYLGLNGEKPSSPELPGRDFSPLLRGQALTAAPAQEVFYEYEFLRCVRTDRWKYIERQGDGYDELYDLQADPGELVNLAMNGDASPTRQQLQGKLDAFFNRYSQPKYNLWKGGASQARLLPGGEAKPVFDPAWSPPKFQLPPGYVAEAIAAPPLVQHPMMASFDDRGRLFVAEATGVNLPKAELEKQTPNLVRLLEDTDGDGIFDKSTVFADKMTFPQGAQWLNGALYVASPPSIWKLVDTNDDGVADERTELVTGFDYTGNAADVHGPFLHPNGHLYWCHGRKGHEVHEPGAEEKIVSKNKGARIWSCLPDGSDIQVHAGGGMDNPVEIDFTPEGEILGTINIFHGRPREDVIVHWLWGGRYPREDMGPVLEEFKITGDLLQEVYSFGHVAVSGMTLTRDGHILTALFNTQKVAKTRLVPSGSTFSATTEDFLTIENPDVHLTDVLEDADGSIIVVDTGGWFRIGCPTSQIAKPEIPGAIYRIRKSGLRDTKTDWYGTKLAWKDAAPAELAKRLDDAREPVRERAIAELALRGNAAIEGLKPVLANGSEEAKRNAVWALARMRTPEARAARRAALADASASVLQTTCNSFLMDPDADPDTISALSKLLGHANPALYRSAVTALGRTANPAIAERLAAETRRQQDRETQHALVHALIELNQFEATKKALAPYFAQIAKVTWNEDGIGYWALDQMADSRLQAADVVAILGDPHKAKIALAIAKRHPEWNDALVAFAQTCLPRKEDLAARRELFNELAPSLLSAPAMQEKFAEGLKKEGMPGVFLSILGRHPSRMPAPESWVPSLLTQLTPRSEYFESALVAMRRLDHPTLAEKLQALAADVSLPERHRFLALQASSKDGKFSEPAFALLQSLLSPAAEMATRGEAIAMLAEARLSKEQLIALAKKLPETNVVDFRGYIVPFTQGQDAQVGQALAEGLANCAAAESVSLEELRRLLTPYPAASTQAAAGKLKALELAHASRIQRLEQLVPRVAQEGDAARGKVVFESGLGACITCHRIGDKGVDVGPDLTTIGRIRAERDLLESILLPGASLARDYEAVLVTMKDGAMHMGVIRGETLKGLTLAAAGGTKVELERENIRTIAPAPASLMPMGLEQTLSEAQLLDLVMYLDKLE